MIAEINILKKSLPNADKILNFKPEIEQQNAKRKVIREEIGNFNKDIIVLEKELDLIRKE